MREEQLETRGRGRFRGVVERLVVVGIGPRLDFSIDDFRLFLVDADTLLYGGVSLTNPFFIPAGATVRLRGTVTLIADPNVTLEIMPLPENLPRPDLGFGASTDALQIFGIPEPSGVVLVACGLTGLVVFRRKRLPDKA